MDPAVSAIQLCVVGVGVGGGFHNTKVYEFVQLILS